MELMAITSTWGQGVTTRCGILTFLIMEVGNSISLMGTDLMA
ncbi:hypothetical protein Gotur_032422 [Gossypium turneri]